MTMVGHHWSVDKIKIKRFLDMAAASLGFMLINPTIQMRILAIAAASQQFMLMHLYFSFIQIKFNLKYSYNMSAP